MKWWKAIWQALLTFFRSILGEKDPENKPQPQEEEQDQIAEDAQHEIEEIPNKTDAELLDSAINSGIVHGQPEGTSGARGLDEDSDSDRKRKNWKYYWSKTSSKTKRRRER